MKIYLPLNSMKLIEINRINSINGIPFCLFENSLLNLPN